jgi:RNA polymerase sigma-70 factor (ECF subfamily)
MDAAALRQAGSEPSLRDQLLGAVPSLRAFAFSLTQNWDRADDLVQDTLLRAWGAIDRFERGSNMHAWLFTILRNVVHTDYRKKKREVADPDGVYSAKLRTHPNQQSHIDFQDMQAALDRLTHEQREALLLVAAQGLSYEDTAQITGVAVGTVKSRVNRARVSLAMILNHNAGDEFGPDDLTKAALQAEG